MPVCIDITKITISAPTAMLAAVRQVRPRFRHKFRHPTRTNINENPALIVY
jgi:hypothetical protein